MTVLVDLKDFQLVQDRQQILHNISFEIHSGERVAIVGASGAGKSSLLSEIHRRLRERSALCPQQLGLVDGLSAYHNIYMAQLEHHGFMVNAWNLFFPLPSARRDIGLLAEEFGLSGLLNRATASLSGGERQRVALARACYRLKSIFLGDEPVSSLDPEQGQRLLEKVFDHHETVVVALHNPTLALQNFHRVIGLRGGQIAFDRSVDNLTADFLTRFYRGE